MACKRVICVTEVRQSKNKIHRLDSCKSLQARAGTLLANY